MELNSLYTADLFCMQLYWYVVFIGFKVGSYGLESCSQLHFVIILAGLNGVVHYSGDSVTQGGGRGVIISGFYCDSNPIP